MPGSGRILDRIAISLSSLCLLHCMATPVILLLLPAASLSLAIPESFHIWMLLLAIPVSILALRAGHKHHRLILPSCAAVTGLCLLGMGAFVIPTEMLELIVTVAGAVCLAAAHFWNARLIAASEPR